MRLAWEAQEELRKKKEKEDKVRREHERRLNPKTKEDFELLYHALECKFFLKGCSLAKEYSLKQTSLVLTGFFLFFCKELHDFYIFLEAF